LLSARSIDVGKLVRRVLSQGDVHRWTEMKQRRERKGVVLSPRLERKPKPKKESAMSNVEIQSQQVTGTTVLYFSGEVKEAYVMLQGFDSSFTQEHQFRDISVGAKITGKDGKKVTVEAWAKVRDDHGHNSSGPVNVVVFAELADA